MSSKGRPSLNSKGIARTWGQKYIPGVACPSTCKNGTHACGQCAASFVPKWPSGTHLYCSNKCRVASYDKSVSKHCPGCNKAFRHSPSYKNRRYCSKECWSASSKFANRRSARHVADASSVYGCACLVCGFDRLVEYAHILPASLGGTISPSNILPLCPNHHTLFDRGLLTLAEMQTLSRRLQWL